MRQPQQEIANGCRFVKSSKPPSAPKKRNAAKCGPGNMSSSKSAANGGNLNTRRRVRSRCAGSLGRAKNAYEPVNFAFCIARKKDA